MVFGENQILVFMVFGENQIFVFYGFRDNLDSGSQRFSEKPSPSKVLGNAVLLASLVGWLVGWLVRRLAAARFQGFVDCHCEFTVAGFSG